MNSIKHVVLNSLHTLIPVFHSWFPGIDEFRLKEKGDCTNNQWLIAVILLWLTPLLFGDIPVDLEIMVQVHPVAFGNNHSSILIIPRNQEKYTEDPRFTHTFTANGEVFCYATIGASFNSQGLLVSDINRLTDVNLDNKVEFAKVDLGGAEADEIIALLFERNGNYKDNLDYDLFPARTKEEQRWFLPDDSYNSNSYISGLIISCNLKAPELTHRVPGYDKPVPASHFHP